MLTQETLTELVQLENVDAINSVYKGLPFTSQRFIDQLTAKYWNKEVSELEEF